MKPTWRRFFDRFGLVFVLLVFFQSLCAILAGHALEKSAHSGVSYEKYSGPLFALWLACDLLVVHIACNRPELKSVVRAGWLIWPPPLFALVCVAVYWCGAQH